MRLILRPAEVEFGDTYDPGQGADEGDLLAVLRVAGLPPRASLGREQARHVASCWRDRPFTSAAGQLDGDPARASRTNQVIAYLASAKGDLLVCLPDRRTPWCPNSKETRP